MDQSKTFELEVRRAQSSDVGKGRVLLHHSKRDGLKRHAVVRLTSETGLSVLASAVGNDRLRHRDTIRLDYDQRNDLGVSLESKVKIEVRKVGLLGTLWWYTNVSDPLVKISSRIALISLLLGVFSMILGLASVFS